MGATGPSGGFDIHNFFNKAPPIPHPQYASHPSYPHHFHQNPGSFPINPVPLPRMPQNFQYSTPQQPGQSQVYHPYLHYQQEHGLRHPSYTAAPYNQQQSPPQQFLPSDSLDFLNSDSLSSLPLSSVPQGSGCPTQASTCTLDGARLMALLTTNIGAEAPGRDDGSLRSGTLQSAGERSRSSHEIIQDIVLPPPAMAPASPTAPPAPVIEANSSMSVRSSGKQPRGRHLRGDHVVYDVDVRNPGEAQPQLEVSPITVYGSDPLLVVGRQIAVNKRYICYGLRQGTIRILNINTALRALLRGHTQRVTDMVFMSEDQHLLASASVDGRIYVRRILEGPSAEGGKILITEQLLLAIQIVGDWDFCHPRVCWNLQTQDVLEVSIGKVVLSINVVKVQQAAPHGGFLADKPLKCEVDIPLEGVHVVGAHNGTITDLAVPSFSAFKVASASEDGTMRIWGDSNQNPLLNITPHVGETVAAVAFLSALRRPDHHVLLTAGPLNRELKLWAPTTGPVESPSGRGTWSCIQSLEFQSSDAPDGKYEDVFFNQLVVAPRSNLIILANAKKNAIYAVHVEFGHSTAAARMNYLAEFSVTMPILSLAITEENVTEAGEGKVQIYCVQTQAIQQYGLDVSQCLPPVDEASKSIGTPEASEYVGTPESLGLSSGQDSVRSDISVPHLIDMGPGLKSGSSNAACIMYDVNDPARTPATSSVFGSPVEVGRLEVLNAHLLEESTARDFSTFLQGPGNIQNSAKPSVQMSIESEVVSPVGNSRPSTLRRPCSRSPPRAFRAHHTSVGVRMGEDINEIGPESSSLMSPISASQHDRAPSCNICAEERPEKLEMDVHTDSGIAKPSKLALQGGNHKALHLITPSELMNLAAGSKPSEAYSAPLSFCGQEQSINHGKALPFKATCTTDGFSPVESSIVLEKEVVETTNLVVENSIAGKELLVSSMLESLEPTQIVNIEVDKEPSIPHESNPTFGYISDRHIAGSSQIEEDKAPEDKDGLVIETDEVYDKSLDLTCRDGSGDLPSPSSPATNAKGRKNKNKTNVGRTSPSSVYQTNISTTGSKSEGETRLALNPISLSMPASSLTATPPPIDPAFLAQVASMQDSLNQLVTMQKEIQKQMTVMVAVPVAKEGKRMEGALGQRMEKVLKAQVDAMWARLAEENARREKQERERAQQVTMLLTNFVSKDMPVALEQGFKKEFSAIGPVVAQAVLPPLHKAVSTTVAESFQGFTEKMVPQLEKLVGAKLEGTVTRQIQTQFQTIGRQVLQEALRACFEISLLPAFERTCQSMFEHVESSFQHGMAEYTQHAQEQLLFSHSDLASTLKDTVASAKILADSLTGELADGQKKLLSLAENAGANAARILPANIQINSGLPDKVLSLQHLEESLDPTIELSRLLKECKLEEAFNKALSLSDVAVVSWLCMQMDETRLFNTVPLPLSQGVLLSLVQQLGCDLDKDKARKLSWIREAALALNPDDPLLAPHMRPFLEQLYQNLHRQVTQALSGEQANLRLVIHVVHSLLISCK